MSRSRFWFCAGMAGLCGTSAFAGMAYNFGAGQADKALAGGAVIGAGCLAAVSAVWAAGQLLGRRASRRPGVPGSARPPGR